MISKPPQNWSNEDKVATAAQSAVAVAKFAGGATKRGFSLVKAIFLGGFAALWGLAGLGQLVVGGFGGAPHAASGILILLMAAIPGYFAWRNLSKAFGWDSGPRPRPLSSEADTDWRQENAFNQPSNASFGFDRNGASAYQFAPQP